ncbi:MAG: hypothetical protein Q8O10_00245 [candidate division Zixibacteria bacterium]|nr:hypothetical protein [candidate division Zixibacteria bacterium]
MVLNSVLESLLEGIEEGTIRQIGKRRKKKNLYCVICPACGSRVVKKELMEKGCYVCGYQETPNKKPASGPYRINCPKCGATVVKEKLLKKGCYICGSTVRVAPFDLAQGQ